MHPSPSIMLFGTEEPVGAMTPLKAGMLEASLDAGNLRYITIGGTEALRGIAFLVRDKNWGTYNPEISNLDIAQSDDGFTVTYDAVCRDDEQSFRYAARIEGRADGSLTFSAEGEALTDFVTNRTGFVVLHALAGVVGEPVTVEHTDGRIVESRFPEQVDPACPFQDIRALSHEIAPGLTLSCRMEGDAFEMEDHRNWMDASYKTYVRPLAKPWPYTIARGETTTQSVTLTLAGAASAGAAAGAGPVVVTVADETIATMPRIGLAVPAEHAQAALDRADLLRSVGADYLVCGFDPRKGHGAADMRRFGDLGKALGAELVLEAIVPCLDADGDPTADPDILKHDMALIRDAADGVTFARVAVSPASDLKCTLPGSIFPPAPSWQDLFAEARAAFPNASVGGGMFSYFTELNRKRPPAEALDFICHSGCPIVHAGDDISVTETLEALPSIFTTVRAFAGGKPYWIFPAAVSMRDNPYGAVPAENPDNIRQAMNRVDPRDRGLLGAAWYSGYLAHAARAGLEAVTLAAVAGPSGVVYSPQDHAQPWFDDAGAAAMPSLFPLRTHAALKNGRVMRTDTTGPRDVQALAVEHGGTRTLVLSNLTGTPQPVRIEGFGSVTGCAILDETSFEAFCRDPATPLRRDQTGPVVELAPYAIAVLTV